MSNNESTSQEAEEKKWTYKQVPYKSTYKVYDQAGYCYIDVRTETEAKLICDKFNRLDELEKENAEIDAMCPTFEELKSESIIQPPVTVDGFLKWYGEDRWKNARKSGGVSITTIEQYARLYYSEKLREAEEVSAKEMIPANEFDNWVESFTAHKLLPTPLEVLIWTINKLSPKIAAMKEKYSRLYEENAGQYLDLHQAKNTIAQLQAEKERLTKK